MADDRYDAGMRVRREVLGDDHVDRANAAMTPLDADFQRFITEMAWGSVWTRDDAARPAHAVVPHDRPAHRLAPGARAGDARPRRPAQRPHPGGDRRGDHAHRRLRRHPRRQRGDAPSPRTSSPSEPLTGSGVCVAPSASVSTCLPTSALGRRATGWGRADSQGGDPVGDDARTAAAVVGQQGRESEPAGEVERRLDRLAHTGPATRRRRAARRRRGAPRGRCAARTGRSGRAAAASDAAATHSSRAARNSGAGVDLDDPLDDGAHAIGADRQLVALARGCRRSTPSSARRWRR